MAESIVNLVLTKLTDATVKETLRLYQAGGKLDALQHELRWIQAFLKDAEIKQNSNERVKTWVSEVREVAYRIEDVVDTFMAEVDDNNNQPAMNNFLNRVIKKAKMLPINYKLTYEFDEIQAKLHEIKEWTERYGVNRELGDNSSAVPTRRPVREVVLPDVDDLDVIGLETDKENIVKLLLDPNTRRRCVVSVVGQGGLGKTTLAKKAYNSDEVKGAFEFRFWLSVSQQYKLIDLLKMLLEGIRPLKQHEKDLLQTKDPASQQRAEEHFIIKLNTSLREKRYLIIMDDVWTEDLWTQVEKALPDVKNGSRVLVTTRFSEFARRADPTCDPYNLRFLREEESVQLLLKKAFPYQDPEAYLNALSDLPKRFAIKCGGLPLALIVVGGLLSRQQPTYSSWHKVFTKFSWQTNDGMRCTQILTTSYEDMPAVLKPCFMYFASFPEDYEINVKFLIRIWVSEGLIPEINGRTMEETAEDYLEDLVQRSMIQVSTRSYNGSIKYCRIHDLLHDLAIEKAKENNFLQIISTQVGQNCSSSTVRRATLHCNCEDIKKYTGQNLRSFLCFSNYMPKVVRFKYLKVLCQMTWGHEISLANISEITQLRYLGYFAPYGQFGFDYEIEFWENISCMRNLQTIHIKGNIMDCSRADCIWNIKTLRHVSLPLGSFGPPSTADLPNLQTLKSVMVRESWLTKGWPKMPSIRMLGLWDFPPDYEESFHNFLNGLHNLTSLCIVIGSIIIGGTHHSSSYEMLDMSTLPSYNLMQSLVVNGDWNPSMRYKALDICFFPIHLIKLSLNHSNIEEDPMPVLENLKSLRRLELFNTYNGKQLSCAAGGFPRLECLRLIKMRYLEDWKVEKGGMPLLKKINITWCYNLVTIPDLQHMTSLNALTIKDVRTDLPDRLRGEESYKIQHIPLIEIK
ncbi:hypothetical protein LUZ61_010877 [Rhynchospora tenuis]|uniref:Uncharacterized protein n=1 Tax=Rhynchospora tenuis TaxID=198213 RepID=A0AAD6EZN4_9POAL|nr:hypothetical protein LUZ61_010877 [Rhynchospora tenuis]